MPLNCKAPVVNKPNPSIDIAAGSTFAYKIPELTFVIPQGGNTRQLKLNLAKLSGPFPSKCWFSFDETSQTISGLTYTTLLANKPNAEMVFRMTATISCGQNTHSVATNLSLNIQKSVRHCFEMTFSFKTSNSFACEWAPVKMFAEKVAVYYGLTLHLDVTILNYSKISDTMFSIKIAFSKEKVRCDPCDFKALANLTRGIIQKSNTTIRPEFVSFMLPTFEVTSAQTFAVGTCGPVTTTSAPIPTATG